ncbi:hypothetical protein DM02DRAFT_658515 [Periconia macrospinosa]|uniref:Uncharacterized protein n=1 Tax=Periconia macrospinosa TaxID=97972 RepID=A0A2V1DHS4_9PLEO|nr:hypothetical protein DM02DRAFT_658515 [Periconia macrospinosa]
MNDQQFRLPPLSELISSASSAATPVSSNNTNTSTHRPPFDPTAWARNQPAPTSGPAPPPARVESENHSTQPLLPAPSLQHSSYGPGTAWRSTSPRLASSPPQNGQTLPNHSHHHHHHHQYQQHHPTSNYSQHQQRTPNQSPALPYTPQSLEFPRNHYSPAQSRTSNNPYADPKAPANGPITARQDSAVAERDLPQPAPVQSHAPASSTSASASASAAHAATSRYQDTPILAHDHHSYPPRLLSPAPSPEHVSLSTSSQRRKTSPPPGIKVSTLETCPRRSRASSDPKPGISRDPATTRRAKSNHLLHNANMPPPSGPVQQHQGTTASLQPPAEITHAALDGPDQIRCLSCNDLWSFTQPTTLTRSSPAHDMLAFTDSIINNLQQQVKVQDEQYLQWKNDHVLELVDGESLMPCPASQRAAAERARSSKRKAEAPLEDTLVHAKLRRLSVDSSNATQLTPPPEPNSTPNQPSRGPLYKFETESGGVAELDENVAVLLKHPGVRPHYDAPSNDTSNMWARPRSRLANRDLTAEAGSPAPKTPER